MERKFSIDECDNRSVIGRECKKRDDCPLIYILTKTAYIKDYGVELGSLMMSAYIEGCAHHIKISKAFRKAKR